MIGVVKYHNAGNQNSILRVLEKYRVNYTIVDDPDLLSQCDKVILPGIGSFDTAIKSLREQKMIIPLTRYAETKPVLGICLGMHIMCNSSDEGKEAGLGLIDVHVMSFNDQALPKVNIGWRSLSRTCDQNAEYYFCHQYFIPSMESTTEFINYGTYRVSAEIRKDHLWGIQYHPERSHIDGMYRILEFVNA